MLDARVLFLLIKLWWESNRKSHEKKIEMLLIRNIESPNK